MSPETEREPVRLTPWRAQPWEVWVAVAAVVSSVSFLLFPDTLARSVVATVDPRLATAWNILYGLGGLGILAGYFRRSPRLLGAGLCLLGGGISVSGVAILTLRGAASLTSAAVQLGAAVACVIRLQTLGRVAGR